MDKIRPIPNDPMLPRKSDRCRCMECGKYFNSTYGFTSHRVGDWEARGLNRRCLSAAEMITAGWETNQTGHWIKETLQKRQERGGAPHPSL